MRHRLHGRAAAHRAGIDRSSAPERPVASRIGRPLQPGNRALGRALVQRADEREEMLAELRQRAAARGGGWTPEAAAGFEAMWNRGIGSGDAFSAYQAESGLDIHYAAVEAAAPPEEYATVDDWERSLNAQFDLEQARLLATTARGRYQQSTDVEDPFAAGGSSVDEQIEWLEEARRQSLADVRASPQDYGIGMSRDEQNARAALLEAQAREQGVAAAAEAAAAGFPQPSEAEMMAQAEEEARLAHERYEAHEERLAASEQGAAARHGGQGGREWAEENGAFAPVGARRRAEARAEEDRRRQEAIRQSIEAEEARIVAQFFGYLKTYPQATPEESIRVLADREWTYRANNLMWNAAQRAANRRARMPGFVAEVEQVLRRHGAI